MIFHCPHCGLKAAPGKSDCTACGRAMTRACAECRESIAVDSRTCKYCGAETRPSPAAAPAAAPAKPRSCCAPGVKLLAIVLVLSLGAAALFVMKGRPEKRVQPARIERSAPPGSW